MKGMKKMKEMKNKILNILKNSDDYVSGETISTRLGISRAAVWKYIKKLRSEGYEIASVTRRGYLLTYSDAVSAEAVSDGLNTEFIGRHIFYYDSTDSTNNRAKAEHNAPDGSIFIAETQNGGKGRRGRAWESPKGTGIFMSLLLKPDIPPEEISRITLIAGLAVCRAVGNGAMIKWPNDVVIGSKKICGILTELAAEDDMISYVVCGIGVNVNTENFDEELAERATSLLIETEKKHKRAEIVRKILEEFEALYKEFLQNRLDNILPEYEKRCVTVGREVRVVYRNKSVSGKAIGVTADGALIVDTPDGKITVNSGEVSVRGMCGYI